MGKGYLSMKTDPSSSSSSFDLLGSDLQDIGQATKKLFNHTFKLTLGLSLGTGLLQWIATVAAMGDIGKWVAFVAVVLRLFFPKNFPNWLELPASLILLAVVAPNLVAYTIRDSWIGVGICLGIGAYLLQEHIRASGGFRNSFTKANGISNSVGIVILLVYPVWALIFDVIL